MDSGVQTPQNEAVRDYAPGSPERGVVAAAMQRMQNAPPKLPSVIGGRQVFGDDIVPVRCPHRHASVVATLHRTNAEGLRAAIAAALAAAPSWSRTPLEDRAAVFLRAADLLAGRYRTEVVAATMLGQSKTVHQAEVDAACELVDFLRWNGAFAQALQRIQPCSTPEATNRLDYRPLEGFVLAITPFNFTAIAGNLPSAPALLGNTVVWKCATTQALSAQVVMEVFQEAGLPPGVINLVHAPALRVSEVALAHRDLAGVHFTGSTATFQHIWQTVGARIAGYRSYPRIVGETGGKDFIFAHESADVDALATAILRGAFEYQGQKCSAVSRVYVAEKLWGALAERLQAELPKLRVGDVADFRNFLGAVIDGQSFAKLRGEVQNVGAGARRFAGGECDDRIGYFVQPTVVLAEDPRHRLMQEELFGPVVTIHCYADEALEDTLRLCDETSPYALTGAVFARDRAFVAHAGDVLRHSAGNFYINDKPTGAVVGQQPFGGGRASGTNDKAGSLLNLMRWVSPRTIKENLNPPRHWEYPFLG
jgi:1-pyrroline-5-carboxylate dehydrogenase